MIDRWITDAPPSSRFPYYTRANADEVGPEPFSPLGWSIGWETGTVPGVLDGFVGVGAVTQDEFRPGPYPEVFGNWGGYFYNQLSVPRVFGVRMPGASPEAIDNAYFGDRPGVPKYKAEPWHENAELSARLGETMAITMSRDSIPRQEAMSELSRQMVLSRPEYKWRSNRQLADHARMVAGPLLRHVWSQYCETVLMASLGPGAVQMVCAAIGRPEAAVQLLSAVGDVESADSSLIVWDLSRVVKGSSLLSAEFDTGVVGVLDRLRVSDHADAVAFLEGFAALLATHGHRGPNEWDMRAHSWETKPELVLGMIERVRFQEDARSPRDAAKKAVVVREQLLAELTALLKDDAESLGTLQAGLHSATVHMRAREMGKMSCIRLINEGKLAMMEVGRRMVADGVLEDPQQIFMLLNSELDGFLAEPQAYVATIREREAIFAELAELEPPYIVKYEDGVPPISEWRRRGRKDVAAVTVGELMQGSAGSPGKVTGRARIVLHPEDADDLGPGDIMIAPTTDPSWTPLFLSVDGVVCDVGAVNSHAAIVSRELGVPCAVSVLDATDRIPDGATIELDGSAGTVRIVALA